MTSLLLPRMASAVWLPWLGEIPGWVDSVVCRGVVVLLNIMLVAR